MISSPRLDGEGRPRFIWRTTEITIKPLKTRRDKPTAKRRRTLAVSPCPVFAGIGSDRLPFAEPFRSQTAQEPRREQTLSSRRSPLRDSRINSNSSNGDNDVPGGSDACIAAAVHNNRHRVGHSKPGVECNNRWRIDGRSDEGRKPEADPEVLFGGLVAG